MIGYDKRYVDDPQPFPGYDFTLPDGYSSVFSMGLYFYVVVNNKVQPYERIGDKWQLVSNYDITLPDGHTTVFSIGAFVCAVVNNMVRFYCRKIKSL